MIISDLIAIVRWLRSIRTKRARRQRAQAIAAQEAIRRAEALAAMHKLLERRRLTKADRMGW